MKKTWQRWSARYAALSSKEQVLIVVALLLGVPFLEQRLLKDSIMAQRQQNAELLISKRSELANLQTKALALEAGKQVDPHAEMRARLEATLKRSAELEASIWSSESAMITAAQMPELLKKLLRQQSGLRLVDLHTLPVTPLVAPPSAPEGAGASARSVPVAAAAKERGLFKHGVELRLEGSYSELVSYLTALENAPQRLLWDSLTIAAESYPRVVLTLTVYTVNLERRWLVV